MHVFDNENTRQQRKQPKKANKAQNEEKIKCNEHLNFPDCFILGRNRK
jgi:hypothetical protein